MQNELIRKFSDSLGLLKDNYKKLKSLPKVNDNLKQHGCIWARTEVIGSYSPVRYNPHGKSSFNETVFDSSNTVPIGGVQYLMESLFDVRGPITVPTLYDQTGIGLANSPIPSDTYKTPNGDKIVTHRIGHHVCLFGVGITGTAENDVTVYPVDYRENSIELSRVTTDGATLTGAMIPFRFTASTLNEYERKKYFGKYVDSAGITGYYLKAFETDVTIKHIWKSGKEVDSETEVAEDEIWENLTGVNTIETFAEIILKVSKEDVKEWYNYLDQDDRARINTIALYTGEFMPNEAADGYGDYRDCMLFSKLNIPVEYLSLSKDLNIIYRVYGS